ncbi:MAG: hypothetical protein P8N52_07995 [Crocinitomicaceae bacterium]|nr:hypothetical protein [Crocinitomicaceae bacterium]
MVSSLFISFKQAGIIAGLFCFTLLHSCNNKKVVASVDDVELTESDAYIIMSHLGLNPIDSIQLSNFITDWCTRETFKAELKHEFPEKWKLTELRAQSFASDLAEYYLEELELKKKLDTIVKKQEIDTYYNSHKEEFILHDYIVKALYLKIPKELDFKSEDVHVNYLLKNDKDLTELNSYAKLYAENYYFNDSTWIYFEEVTKDIPVGKFNIDNIVLNRTKTYFSDENFTYFLNIIDYKLKDEVPPVDFLSNEIKSRIVANRLQELKEKNESKLIQRIKKKHEIIISI